MMICNPKALNHGKHSRKSRKTRKLLTICKHLTNSCTGVPPTYGGRIAAMLLNSGLADEIVVVTLPKVAGGDEKVRTVYGI